MVDKYTYNTVKIVNIESTQVANTMAVFATHCVEVHSNDLPHSAPLQPHTVHVIVGDLYDLLEAEHPRMGGTGQLLVRYSTQSFHKVN